MNADTRTIVEIIDTRFKEKRVMQRCDRCILRNRMARIPCTLRVPTPHPERVLRATFQSFHKEPCAGATRPDPCRSQATRLPRSSPHIPRPPHPPSLLPISALPLWG